MTSLQELPRVAEAAVYKDGRLAAWLRRRPDAVEFRYDSEYLDDNGPPVATTLPLSDVPVMTRAGALPPFFSGLLPEGRRLSALRRAAKTSADDELALLLAVGRDTVGDVQIVQKGEAPDPSDAMVAVDSWEDVTFSEVFARSVDPTSPEPDLVAIPGVQAKLSARMTAVPVAQRDARYILKLNPPEFPFVVENEAFFLDAAKASGLEVAEAQVVRDARGDAGLLVTRFDRVSLDHGEVAAIPQEDACQVLARYPADKYAVSAEEVTVGLSAVCRARPVAARDILRQLAFAYLIGNGDAHAKNFSVRRVEGEWRVTPAYDVLSSHPYGDHTMALTLAERRREDIIRRTFEQFGATVGLPPRAVGGVLDGLCDRVERWIDGLDALPFDQRTVHKLRRTILDRRAKLGRGSA